MTAVSVVESIAYPVAPGDVPVTIGQGDLATMEHQIEELTEQMSLLGPSARAMLRADEVGWSSLTQTDESALDREQLLLNSARARLMSIADPIIKRCLGLRVAYVWGRGAAITAAAQEGSAEQDVNAVVQAFLDDPSNRDGFASAQAHQERERAFGIDGNVFLSLVTDPMFGRVQVRTIPMREITDRVSNP